MREIKLCRRNGFKHNGHVALVEKVIKKDWIVIMNFKDLSGKYKSDKQKIPDAIYLKVDPDSKGDNIKIPFIKRLEGKAELAPKYVTVTEEIKVRKYTMTDNRTGEVTVWYEEIE